MTPSNQETDPCFREWGGECRSESVGERRLNRQKRNQGSRVREAGEAMGDSRSRNSMAGGEGGEEAEGHGHLAKEGGERARERRRGGGEMGDRAERS